MTEGPPSAGLCSSGRGVWRVLRHAVAAPGPCGPASTAPGRPAGRGARGGHGNVVTARTARGCRSRHRAGRGSTLTVTLSGIPPPTGEVRGSCRRRRSRDRRAAPGGPSSAPSTRRAGGGPTAGVQSVPRVRGSDAGCRVQRRKRSGRGRAASVTSARRRRKKARLGGRALRAARACRHGGRQFHADWMFEACFPFGP